MISTPGLTIRGRAGAMILLQAPVVPFLCNGSDDTIDGLTMTSNAPYPVEFIQIGGDGNQILNCQIYGPAQPGDSSTWVVNRGFVTQGNATNLLVRNNVFHTLRQPAYLNPGSTGTIMDNVAYNTRGYVVDQATFLFSGNSWGLPANAVDIALLSGHGVRSALRSDFRAAEQQQQRHDQRSAIKARPPAKLASAEHRPSDGSKAGADLAPAFILPTNRFWGSLGRGRRPPNGIPNPGAVSPTEPRRQGNSASGQKPRANLSAMPRFLLHAS